MKIKLKKCWLGCLNNMETIVIKMSDREKARRFNQYIKMLENMTIEEIKALTQKPMWKEEKEVLMKAIQEKLREFGV